ncbi:trans-aconitate 2-methyltransferase [Bartonella sp. LJL80]
MQDWSAKQYLKFEDERTRPVRDLANAIPLQEPAKIVDIGCGPGNSTEVLLQHWPHAQISGFDSSPNMIEKAKERLPDLEFDVTNIECWSPPSDCDILFSNAVFQWIPKHIEELQRLLAEMKQGAVLAVQMPDNLMEPSHRAMIEVAQDPRWQARIGHAARNKLPDVSVYYDAFAPFARHIDLWHSIYNHTMANHSAIVEWVKGTGLRPFLDPLDQEERETYLSLYLEQIERAYPQQMDGKVLLRFPRLFMVLVK